MKSILIVLSVVLVSITSCLSASDTLYYRFSNYIIKDASPYDTLIMDIDIKASTPGTYVTSLQIDLQFNPVVFGDNAQPVSITHLAMIGPGIYFAIGSSTSASSYRYGLTPFFPPYTPSNFSQVPTNSWGKALRLKFLILNNSQNSGIQFSLTPMASTQRFIFTTTYTLLSYGPINATNNLLNLPAAPSEFDLMISEVGDPSDSNADFVELYNAGSTPINFSETDWYLTVYNGSQYQNVLLSGNLNPGECHVVGGSLFASAYPGKTAEQTSGIVEQNGTVSYFISVLNSYDNGGIFTDQYNGTTLPFNGKHAVRKFLVTAPGTSFSVSDWVVTPAANMDMTPGSHRTTIVWDGNPGYIWADTANWTPSFIPDAGHNVQVPAAIEPPPYLGTGTSANVHNLENGTD